MQIEKFSLFFFLNLCHILKIDLKFYSTRNFLL